MNISDGAVHHAAAQARAARDDHLGPTVRWSTDRPDGPAGRLALLVAIAVATGSLDSTAQDMSSTGSRLPPAQMRLLTDRHNALRAAVGVPPLHWSASLALLAQDWVDQLAQTHCSLEHRPHNRFGENLFAGTASAFNAADAVVYWGKEGEDYPGGAVTAAGAPMTGHYTQIVWTATRAFGCAEALCRDLRVVACNYDPAGNMLGQAPY